MKKTDTCLKIYVDDELFNSLFYEGQRMGRIPPADMALALLKLRYNTHKYLDRIVSEMSDEENDENKEKHSA